jgi:hypothetical protein
MQKLLTNELVGKVSVCLLCLHIIIKSVFLLLHNYMCQLIVDRVEVSLFETETESRSTTGRSTKRPSILNDILFYLYIKITIFKLCFKVFLLFFFITTIKCFQSVHLWYFRIRMKRKRKLTTTTAANFVRFV